MPSKQRKQQVLEIPNFAGTTKLLRSKEAAIMYAFLDSKLTVIQLNKDLGVGNATPGGAPTRLAWQGWNGKAQYNFVMAGWLTPFLTNVQQMNNWNYVLFGTKRKAVEKKGQLEQPVSKRLKDFVDAHVGEANRRTRSVLKGAKDTIKHN